MKNSTLVSNETVNENSFYCCFKNFKRNSNIFLIMILFMGSFIQGVSAQGSLVPACNIVGDLTACAVSDPSNTANDFIITVTVARSGAPNLLTPTNNANFNYVFLTNTAAAFIRSYGPVIYNSTTNVTTQNLTICPGTSTPEFNLQLHAINTSSSPATSCVCNKSVSVSKVAATSTFTPIECFGGLSTLTVVGSLSSAGTYTYILPGFTALPTSAPGTATFLVPGSVGAGTTYTITVISAEDCTTTTSQTITQPTAVPIAFTCPLPTTTTACLSQSEINTAFSTWLNTFSFSGGTNPVTITRSPELPTAPSICGGVREVTWSATDACGQQQTCTSTFTIPAPTTVALACPQNYTVAAAQTQAAINTAFATWLASATASGGCNGALTNDNVGAPACGATTTVIFKYTSSCEPLISTCSATFTVPQCVTLEGCTLGYWKNHTDRWCGTYRTCDRFGAVFTSAPASLTNLTLLQALNLGGGGIYNLARQGVAALLNTCSGEVAYAGYGDSPLAVIAAVNLAYSTGGSAPGILGSQLDVLNNSGCPLGGTNATTATNCTNRTSSFVKPAVSGNKASIEANVYPNPFANNFKLAVKTNSVEDIEVKVFDMLGKLIESNLVKTADIDTFEIGNSYKSGIYNVIVTQGTEVKIQKVIKK